MSKASILAFSDCCTSWYDWGNTLSRWTCGQVASRWVCYANNTTLIILIYRSKYNSIM